MPTRRNNQAQPQDAIAMLKADHQKVRDLFQQYEATRDPSAKRDVAETVFIELETHTQLEEHVFYPAVNEETEDGPALVKDSLEEHETIKNLIQTLRSMGPEIPARSTPNSESCSNTSNTMWQKKKPPCSRSLRRSLRKT